MTVSTRSGTLGAGPRKRLQNWRHKFANQVPLCTAFHTPSLHSLYNCALHTSPHTTILVD